MSKFAIFTDIEGNPIALHRDKIVSVVSTEENRVEITMDNDAIFTLNPETMDDYLKELNGK